MTSQMRMMKRVDPAADVARQQAERRRRSSTDSSTDATPTQQRDPRAVHEGREHVAALVVGAEQVLRRAALHPRRRQRRIAQLERRQVERVVRRDPAGEHGAEDADERDGGRSRSPPASCGSCARRRRRETRQRPARPRDRGAAVAPSCRRCTAAAAGLLLRLHVIHLKACSCPPAAPASTFFFIAPGQRLLVQRDVADVVLVDLEGLADHRVALLLVGLRLRSSCVSSSSFGLL